MNLGATGSLGEDISTLYLKKLGFSIQNRNFRKKYGEIDIIVLKAETLFFVEVKTVACEIPDLSSVEISRITERYFPEERVTRGKIEKLSRVIQTYLSERGEEDLEWSFAVVAVFVDRKRKKALVRFVEENISL